MSSTEAAPPGCEVRLHDFRARVLGSEPVLADLGAVFPTMCGARAADTDQSTRLAVQTDAADPPQYQLVRDGAVIWETSASEEVLPLLEWAIATAAVEQLGRRYLLFHAGVVARSGQALLLPAPSGSGKTTLVAGLMHAGWQFLSDEVAVVDPETGQVLPFPKSLCVKEGARPVLARLYPELGSVAPRHRFGLERVTYLRPQRWSIAQRPVPVRWVILPRYVAGVATGLEPVPRSAALQGLLEQSFNVRARGPGAVAATAGLLSQATCARLVIGELAAAVELLCRMT